MRRPSIHFIALDVVLCYRFELCSGRGMYEIFKNRKFELIGCPVCLRISTIISWKVGSVRMKLFRSVFEMPPICPELAL
jgi:hypothetical protein